MPAQPVTTMTGLSQRRSTLASSTHEALRGALTGRTTKSDTILTQIERVRARRAVKAPSVSNGILPANGEDS